MNIVVVVDRRTTDDLLGWQSVARSLALRPAGSGGVMLVHAPGETAQRMLEGEGVPVRRIGDRLQVMTDREARLAERAARMDNRHVVSMLTEEGLPAVGFVGGDRGLLRPGTAVPWLVRLMGTGSVAVVSSAVVGTETFEERPMALAARWLSDAVDGFVVILGSSPPRGAKNQPGSTEPAPNDPALLEALRDVAINPVIATVSGLAFVGRSS